jgi:serine/threonine-protein kinase
MADRAAGVNRRELTSDEECLGLLRELGTVGILDAREPDSALTTSVGRGGRTETVYRLSRAVAEAVAQVAPAPRELGRVAEGRYVLVEELGRGALGRTYRARDSFLGRDVAIRMLDVREHHDDVARERFRREIDLARRLVHPLLAATITTVEDGPRPGLVSDFVVGLSLADLVARGPLRPPVAVDLALGLVDLLRYLDDQDVVRLDLKPSHVVITADGRPVVVDLGLARRVGDDQTRLTGVGVVVGTPLYLSPEQLQGRPVDVRSDLYSLGLILVEMLLGHPARGGTVAQIVAQAATSRPDLTGLPGSPQLRDVLTQLLDADPETRHDDPAELAAALEALPEREED